MYLDAFLHLRGALRRKYRPDPRDLTWLAQNLGYLEQLKNDEKILAQHWLNEITDTQPPVTSRERQHYKLDCKPFGIRIEGMTFM